MTLPACGKRPGQRSIEHHPHRVPVGGRGDRKARRLLGRHVGHRPYNVPVRRLRVGPLVHLFRQPEVQKYDAAAARLPSRSTA